MNGVLDRLQIDETSRIASQKNKNEELPIITVCLILERFRNFCPFGKFPNDVKKKRSVSFSLMSVYIYYFLVAKSMLRYCRRKASTMFPRISAHAPIV